MNTRFVRPLALVLASAALALAADGKGANRGEFTKAFLGPDTHKGGKAVEGLNPDIKGDYELLKLVLEKGNWYYRGVAATVLAKTGNPDNLKDLVASLAEKSEKNPYVRQGAAIAIAKSNDRELYPELYKALADKDSRVRREVANVLRINKDKRSIEALITRWKDERDPTVINAIRSTLEDITKRYLGPNQVDWYNWWLAVGEKFEVGSTDEEAAKKAEEEGKKLSEGKTETRDVDLTFTSRGAGSPVIVLPHFGHSKAMMIPFFIECEKFCKVYYMDLPKMDSFKGLKEVAGHKVYPIDKFVDALEEFRKSIKKDRITLMACGFNAWIAFRYVTKYPKSLAALVLIGPNSSDDAYGRASDLMIKGGQASGDLELEHLGYTRSINTQNGKSTHEIYHEDKKIAVPEGEGQALDRKGFTLFFGDIQDSLLDQLYPIHNNDIGGAAFDDYSCFKEPRATIPMLVCSGKRSTYSSESDCAAIAKHYGAQLVAFDRSADLPMIEEPEKFSGALKVFLQKFVGKPPKEKDK